MTAESFILDHAGWAPDPSVLAAEMAVAGAVIQAKSALDEAADLVNADDFHSIAGRVFAAAMRLWMDDKPIEPASVLGELATSGDLEKVGGGTYLATLIEHAAPAGSVTYHARKVAADARRRRINRALVRGRQVTESPAWDPDSDVDLIRKLVDEAAAVRETGTDGSLVDAVNELLDELENPPESLVGVAPPYMDLERDYIPVFRPGQLVVIAARPSVGKTLVAVDIARAAALRDGQMTVMFTLEMSRKEILARMFAAEATVLHDNITSRKVTPEELEKVSKASWRVTGAPLVIDDPDSCSLEYIRSRLRTLSRKGNIGVVIIDYLQLIQPPARIDVREQQVAMMSRTLKRLAREFNTPIVLLAQLNRGPTQRTDAVPRMSEIRESGCMTETTTLLRADTGAPISFRELIDNGFEGVRVWSLNADRRLVSSAITNVFSSGTKETYRLRLASGRQVEATGSHPFLTFGDWKPLDQLAVGDRIAIPRRIPAPSGAGLGWSEHRIGLLAHLIGDGCVIRKQPVHYTSNDEENLQFVEEAASAEFGITPRRVQQKSWWHTYLPAPYKCARGRRNPIHLWLDELGIENLRSYEKRIPDALYAATDDEIAVFLRHLWATDGNVTTAEKGNTAPKVYYATTSRTLADGVALLLGRFGIIARIRTVTKGDYRPGYHVTVADGPSLRTFCQKIGVHGRRGLLAVQLLELLQGKAVNSNVGTFPVDVWDLVKSERLRTGLTERQFQAAIGTRYCGSTLYRVGVSRERLLRCAEALDSDLLRRVAAGDLFWDRIVEIEPIGPRPVYDATVQDTSNFIADGIVAHNSVEQDADIVILLHRPDFYEPESPRAGEVDLIVEKNRGGKRGTVALAHQLHFSRFTDMARPHFNR